MVRVDPKRYQRIREVFYRAAELSGEAQRDYLSKACRDDRPLRRAVEGLLGAEHGATDTPSLAVQTGAVPETIGEYELTRELGRGGMGAVYLARDANGQHVCVKVMHPTLFVHETAGERFAREAELGRRLEHPNVVRTLDHGSESTPAGDVRYLVMEYVDGRDLRAILSEHGSLSDGLVREIGRQVADGLAAMHAHGIVHRDLKPENVIVDGAVQARIVDLGIALSEARDTRLTTPGMFIGSLHYAAPEQLAGAAVDGRADLYSLGVVLFELATGRPPGEGHDEGPSLERPSRQAIEAALDQVDSLSDFLRSLVPALMAVRPEDRIASATELATLLEEGEAGAWWKKQAEASRGTRWPRALAPAPAGRFVGREGAMERLQAAWAQAREGAGGVVLIEGDLGAGKSSLVSAFLDSIRTQDAQALYGAYGAAGTGAIAHAVRTRFGSADLAKRLSRFLDADTGLVEQLLGSPRYAPASEAVLDQLCVRLVERLSRELPTVWVVEDLDKAEPPLRGRILGLASALQRMPALMLVTICGEAPTSYDPRTSDALRRIALPPLTTEEVETLLAEMMDDASAAADLAGTVWHRAAGLPLYVREFVAALRRSSILPVREGGAALLSAVQNAELPIGLRALLEARIDTLSDEDRALLDAASVAGEVFDPRLLARALEKPRIPLLERLARLERMGGFIRSDGSHFRFEPAVLRDVLYAASPTSLRAAYHGNLGEAYAAVSEKPPRPREAAPIARHLLRSDDPAAALPYVVAATQHLIAAGQKLAEHDTLVRALQALGDDRVPLRLRLLGLLASALVRLDQREAAARTCEQAVTEAIAVDDVDGQVDLSCIWASMLNSTGRPQDALGKLERVAVLHDRVESAKVRAQFLLARGKVYWTLGRFADAAGDFDALALLGKEEGLIHEEARARGMRGILLQESGNNDAAYAESKRSLELTRKVRDTSNEPPALITLANICAARGHLAEALDFLEEAILCYRRLLVRSGRAAALVNKAAILRILGWFEPSRIAGRESLRLARETNARRIEGYARDGLARLAWDAGDADEAMRHGEAALALRRDIENMPGVVSSLLLLAAMAADRGDKDDALRRLREAAEIAERMSYVSDRVRAAVERAALTGEGTETAVSLFRSHRARLHGEDALRVCLLLWRATGEHDYLDEARARAREILEHAPEEAKEGLFDRSPLLRSIRDASADA